jgi:hypothetical protein
MYDPQLGRYHVTDPLAEWHFNYNPYHYCFNNPINFIDPFGLDTTYILPEPIDPVYITYEPEPGLLKKILQFIGKLLEAGDDIVTGNPEPYKETIVEDGVDMDWYKSEESYGNQNVVTRDNPNYDKIFRDRNRSYKNDNSKTSNTQKQIPDKTIKESTGDKTDSHGKLRNIVPSSNTAAEPVTEVVKQWGSPDSAGVWIKKDSLSDGKVNYTKKNLNNSSEQKSNKKDFQRAWNNW